MIVVDASAALSGLLRAGAARQFLATEQLAAPHLVDAEVASGLRRGVLARRFGEDRGWAALNTWRRLGITRYAIFPMLDRVWELRGGVSPYDAVYIALAESLECTLVTADARLSRAPGIRCPTTVVPS